MNASRQLLTTLLLALFVLSVDVNPLRAEEPNELPYRWIYLQMNMQVKENVPKAREILQRGAAAGYNGVVLADYKLNILDRVPDHYFENIKELKLAADSLGIEIIPAVAPIGYSDGLLAHDVNLVEGIPVRDLKMTVVDGIGVVPQAEQALLNQTFEEAKGDRIVGFDMQDNPGLTSYVDRKIVHSGLQSLRWDNPGREGNESNGNARVAKKVSVKPWHQYHASIWIKAEDFDTAHDVKLFAMDMKGRVLSHSNLSVKPNQEWQEHHVIFNSLENTELRIYCGTWGGTKGKLWMDDFHVRIEPFVNLVRRDGAPLVVKTSAGKILTEGKDFAALKDSKLGNVPYAGSYEVYHTPPKLQILDKSKIPNGTELIVSYFHTVTIHDNQVTCCLDHPDVYRVLESQIASVEKLLSPKTYFLSHDEIRVANWCESCNREGRSAGQLLAQNMKRCCEIIREINPNAKLTVWSDMFDPHHNARQDFYLVNGDLAGSWEGLPKEMMIMNWNHGEAEKSLPFFGGRGHTQILSGFYDSDPNSIRDWLKQSEKLNGRAQGAMYTTWQQDFTKLEVFAKAAWGTRK